MPETCLDAKESAFSLTIFPLLLTLTIVSKYKDLFVEEKRAKIQSICVCQVSFHQGTLPAPPMHFLRDLFPILKFNNVLKCVVDLICFVQ